MELLNESIEIVERNQWICFFKMAVLLVETDKLTNQKQQKTREGFGIPVALRALGFAALHVKNMYE